MKDLILCLDVGNSHIVAGVFSDKIMLRCVRYETGHGGTSDQLGIFLRTVLRENGINPDKIANISIASVVPGLDYSIRAACKKYFQIEPFVLHAGVKTGLKIKYQNPQEVGADLIAGCVAAVKRYPRKNLVVVDFGTATTFCAVSKNKDFLGGLIMPGMRLSMESLQSNTAKLPEVKIVKPERVIGYNVVESIQAGIYFNQYAAVKEIVARLTEECFADEAPSVVGTGGFSHLFTDENLFAEVIPSLVLDGLLTLLQMN